MINKKNFIILIIILIIAISLILYSKSKKENQKQEIILENPLKKIIINNTNEAKITNIEKIKEQALLDFNRKYIDYILLYLEIDELHKSNLGYGNPNIKFILDDESWNTEIANGILSTKKQQSNDEDMIIKTSRKEIINILLSENINLAIENSLKSKNIEIELVADKIELVSKGYLSMYNELVDNKK
ncbi:MAG: hypothetical protein AABW83_02475 [Nanoarchaeota archaeon]